MARNLLFIISFLLSSSIFGLETTKDEIIFFNVGQGHAVLINKARSIISSYVPLLIDAGATAHTYVPDQKYEWKKGDGTLSTSKVSKKIIECWQSANDGHLRKGRFRVICGKVQELGFKLFSPFIKPCEDDVLPSER
ncbi:MAG: hypothetical protein K0M45_08815 [Candidatus Paracaedibacteraceae bacterium]|nr:hypothetical protein [Candidatus Paracaedibacteraceae bacterium]